MLLLSLLWAVSRTQGELRLYLAAELFTTSVIEGVWLIVRDFNDPSYILAYCLMRPISLAFAIWLAGAPTMAIPVVLGQLLAAFLSLGHPYAYTVIAVSEGCAFEFAALVALFNGRYRVLAVMWQLLACFDAGYAAGWNLPQWINLNGYWTYCVASICFLLVALMYPPEGSTPLAASPS
jgi:hypothetical protein